MKTCQNIFESCHEPIGANPYDLCDGCLWWNALLSLRQIIKDEVGGYKNHNHLMTYIRSWLAHCPRRFEDGPVPKELADFEEAFTSTKKDNKLYSAMRLEYKLLKEIPYGMRDNQPSISDILNLPF